ncbi:hypothetical protein FACS1894167_12440 [Synergistales bacterium]|nr:hypothetical protein FACS1894167_12440 [Synergistales bacterium]GHV52551.1 hypothetical protein FACS1894216_08890 [Synergistales bacterium]
MQVEVAVADVAAEGFPVGQAIGSACFTFAVVFVGLFALWGMIVLATKVIKAVEPKG